MQIQNKFIERGYETSAIALCLRWFPIGSWKGGGFLMSLKTHKCGVHVGILVSHYDIENLIMILANSCESMYR